MGIPASVKGVLLLGPFLLAQGCGPADRVPAGNAMVGAVPGSRGGSVAEPAAGPLSAHRPDPARDEAELIRLEQDYAKALMRKDRAFLMRFYATSSGR
ncbi:MAG TPA: hypothetical protein VEW26_10700 [Allosphingosinicella sp.]|nr:hypothetical protein [Allosphingosinicella sp.]